MTALSDNIRWRFFMSGSDFPGEMGQIRQIRPIGQMGGGVAGERAFQPSFAVAGMPPPLRNSSFGKMCVCFYLSFSNQSNWILGVVGMADQLNRGISSPGLQGAASGVSPAMHARRPIISPGVQRLRNCAMESDSSRLDRR